MIFTFLAGQAVTVPDNLKNKMNKEDRVHKELCKHQRSTRIPRLWWNYTAWRSGV